MFFSVLAGLSIMAGYSEGKIRGTARQSLSVTAVQDFNSGKVIGSVFASLGTKRFTEYGAMVRLTEKAAPLYLKVSNYGLGIGFFIKF